MTIEEKNKISSKIKLMMVGLYRTNKPEQVIITDIKKKSKSEMINPIFEVLTNNNKIDNTINTANFDEHEKTKPINSTKLSPTSAPQKNKPNLVIDLTDSSEKENNIHMKDKIFLLKKRDPGTTIYIDLNKKKKNE